ncbi:hypothetical protein D0T84_20860 [Dysgonomonas sp. 521]|uniref:restriction endonuclease subunit S n=1 Tax=Dysgonomonas sp. 521 TaxID=2302932 RepID=UPI0013CFE85B|nr:restriction endonuclease subunit S [Dysgonomonas sp. 521]NDV97330.1 hypothetical protein [Dysgonomonas sp. 521]
MRFPEFTGEWEVIKIKEFGEVVTGATPPTNDTNNYGNDYLWASPSDLGKTKYIINTKAKISEQGFNKIRRIPKNSILVTCIGSTIGKMGVASECMSTNQQINTIITNPSYNYNFVYYAIDSCFPKYLSSIAVQAVPIISKSVFEELKNYAPTHEEQEKIGAFLSLIDQRIETQNKIIEDLKKLKTALVDGLYNFSNKGKTRIRFSEFEEKHLKTTLGNITNNFNRRNKEKKVLPMYSVTNNQGFVVQSEKFGDREMIGEDIGSYKIIESGEFAYNPARINVGSIAQYNGDFPCMISSLYVCFKLKDSIDSSWASYLLKSKRVNLREFEIRHYHIASCLSSIISTLIDGFLGKKL